MIEIELRNLEYIFGCQSMQVYKSRRLARDVSKVIGLVSLRKTEEGDSHINLS